MIDANPLRQSDSQLSTAFESVFLLRHVIVRAVEEDDILNHVLYQSHPQHFPHHAL